MNDVEFRAVFDEHKDAVYQLAWRLCGSPAAAEDIAQDVFLALLRDPQRFDPSRRPLRTFLLGITRNLSLKHMRGEGRFQDYDDEGVVVEPHDIERGEVGEIIGRAVAALPPLQREVVVLAEYDDLSLAEIAQVVGADVGTVKSRLHRARENLRRLLAPLRSQQTPST